MIYQITAPKEAIKPIIKESLKRSNIKYLRIFNIAAFIFWTIIIFSCIFDDSLISHLSREMYDDYRLFMSAQELRVTILFIYLACLLFFSIILLIVHLIYNKMCASYPYYKFDIDLKKGTVKIGKRILSRKISWCKSFMYNDDTIVLKLKSDICKGISIIIKKNEYVTEKEYDDLLMKMAIG